MEAEGFGVIIEGFIWLTDVIDKIEAKHGLTVLEVESVFAGKPLFSRIEKGKIKGEDLYSTPFAHFNLSRGIFAG